MTTNNNTLDYHWGVKSEPDLFVHVGGRGADKVTAYRPSYDGLYSTTGLITDPVTTGLGSRLSDHIQIVLLVLRTEHINYQIYLY